MSIHHVVSEDEFDELCAMLAVLSGGDTVKSLAICLSVLLALAGPSDPKTADIYYRLRAIEPMVLAAITAPH